MILKICFLLVTSLFFSAFAEAAVAYRSKTFDDAYGATSLAPGEPAGAAQNDILIMWVVVEGTSSSFVDPTGGWTLLYNLPAGSADVRVYWIRRGASAPGYSVSWTGSSYAEISVTAWSGVVTSGSPFDNNANNARTARTNPDCPSITTTTNNSMVVALGMSWAGFPSAPTLSTYTLAEGNSVSYQDLAVFYKIKAVAGAENPAAMSGAAASAEVAEITLSLLAAGAASSRVRHRVTND